MSDRVACMWFMNGEGRCFLNGCGCADPFSENGCRIQHDEVFHREGEFVNNFKAGKVLGAMKKADVFREEGIKRGDLVADWFIPYNELEKTMCPAKEIKHGLEEIDRKFDEAPGWHKPDETCVYQNVEMCGTTGVYIMKVERG